jgi:outer membrane protein TolC
MAEAVDQTLKHNPAISRSLALAKAAEARSDKTQSPFWPSLEAHYSYWHADRDPDLDSRGLSSVNITTSYNLFNGGSDWFRLDAAEHRRTAARWQYRSVTADTVLEVRQAYIEVLRANQNLSTAQKSLELLQRQYHDAELRLEQGLIARNDLLRIAVEKASAQQSLVSAESDLVVARQNLSRVIGTPMDNDEKLTEADLLGETPKGREEMQQTMLTSRSELKYLQSLLAAKASDRKAVRGDLLPEIELSHSYERFGNKGFPDSGDADYDSGSTTMLQASWTIFSGFDTRYELAERKHELLALKEEVRATEDLLILQLAEALEAHRVALTNLETARTSVTQAEENYRVNENRYKAQVATTVDLLDAQEFLTRTRNEEVKAQYDLYTAEAVIDRVLERDYRSE